MTVDMVFVMSVMIKSRSPYEKYGHNFKAYAKSIDRQINALAKKSYCVEDEGFTEI